MEELKISSTQSSSEEPSHFDDLISGETMQLPMGDPMETHGETVSSQMLSKDDFYKMFLGGFAMGHAYSKLESLKVEADNQSALNCSNAMYDTIADIPALHFLITPQNKWLERSIAIGMFTIPMAIAVKAELQLRQEPIRETHSKSYRAEPTDDGSPSTEQAQALGA